MDLDLKSKTDSDLDALIIKTKAEFEAVGRLIIEAETERKARATKRYEDTLALVRQLAKQVDPNIVIMESGRNRRKSSGRPKSKYPKGTLYRHKDNHSLTWESGKGKLPWWMQEYGEPMPPKEEAPAAVAGGGKLRPALVTN